MNDESSTPAARPAQRDTRGRFLPGFNGATPRPLGILSRKVRRKRLLASLAPPGAALAGSPYLRPTPLVERVLEAILDLDEAIAGARGAARVPSREVLALHVQRAKFLDRLLPKRKAGRPGRVAL